MRKRILGTLIILLCGLWVTACSKKEAPPPSDSTSAAAGGSGSVSGSGPAGGQEEAASQAQPAAETTSAEPQGQGETVATVNGKAITRSEVDRATKLISAHYQGQVPPERMEQAQMTFRTQALENLINKTVLVQEADRQGMKPSPEEVDARVKKITERFSNPEDLKNALGAMGISVEDLRGEVADGMKVENLLDKNLAKSKEPSQEDIQSFYKEHQQDFQKPEKVRASHILISVQPDDTAETKAQKRQKLVGLQEQIKQGADFDKLASENSDCPSKAQGGDLGYFDRGKMVKSFEEASFRLKPGEVSDIVETEFGFHLIKVTDHQQAGSISSEQASGDISSFLKNQGRQKEVEEYLQKLRSAAKIAYVGNPQAPAAVPPAVPPAQGD